MSQKTVQILINMGFQKEKAEKIVLMTLNQGMEPAVEWFLAQKDDVTGPLNSQEDSASDTKSETNTSSSTVAKLLKCEDSERLFTDPAVREYHAKKSDHTNFAESTEEKKPLNEEEKKEQMKKLEEQLEEKHKGCEAKEKEEELKSEKIQIQSGKNIGAAKKKFEGDNIKKIMDERKREKQEEKVALDRVKAQIEADKLARKKLYGQASAEEQPKQVLPVAASPQKQPKDYTETKLQIRLTNGQIIVQTFNVKEMMAAVRLYIELNRSDGDAPFGLMTSFPRKVFTSDDFEKPLDQLGLVPSAVLILTKPQQ